MNKLRFLVLIFLFLMQISCGATNPANKKMPNYIGEAKMLSDGTIVVHSFIQEVNGEEVHAQIITEYKKNDPNYQIIKKHIGDLKVGETKLVRPFPN